MSSGIQIRLGYHMASSNWNGIIRAFDRPDGFPEGDLALQRSLGGLYNGGKRLTADEAVALSARWRPYRSYLVTYLFAAARQGLIQGSRSSQAIGP